MIFTGNEPVTFSDALPESVDVAIIGGGVAGVMTAWHLARAGVRSLILEKGRVACEQSSRNWGWVRQQGRDAAELPIMIDAIRYWDEIDRVVGDGVNLNRQGVMYLARSEKELESYAGWLKVAEPYQLDTRLVDTKELADLVDVPSAGWVGALWTGSDGRAEPFTAVPAVARRLHGDGMVSIRENCAVRCLDIEAGRVTGVATEDGHVKADAVLLAGGAWSAKFLRNHMIDLPQLTVRSTVARTEPVDSFFEGNAATRDFAFRRRVDGGYTLAPGGYSEHFIGPESFRAFRHFLPVLREGAGVRLRFGGMLSRFMAKKHWSVDDVSPFEETRVLNPPPSEAALASLHRSVDATLPGLAGKAFVESWAGMIDVMPDVVPVMDAVDPLPGLYLGTGFSGHGFGFGPGAGKVLANLITGEANEHNLDRFRFSRFTDGTPMKPGPGL